MSLATSEHTTKAFDLDLRELKCMVAEMGGHVEKQLLTAIDALVRNDKDWAEKVVRADAMLDALQHSIEEKGIATSRRSTAIGWRTAMVAMPFSSMLC